MSSGGRNSNQDNLKQTDVSVYFKPKKEHEIKERSDQEVSASKELKGPEELDQKQDLVTEEQAVQEKPNKVLAVNSFGGQMQQVLRTQLEQKVAETKPDATKPVV